MGRPSSGWTPTRWERRRSTNTSRRRSSRSATPSSPRCTLLLADLLPAACPVASPVALPLELVALLPALVVPPAPPSRRSTKLLSPSPKNLFLIIQRTNIIPLFCYFYLKEL